MKRLLALSDSHGNFDLLTAAADYTKPDVIIHLGDVVEDSEILQQHSFRFPVVRLKGNCDYGSDLPERYLDTVEGVTLFACHGHQYHVKYGLTPLSFAAREVGASLCLFGHTHVRFFEDVGGLILLNPGACSGTVPHCALLTLDAGTVKVSYLKFTESGWCYL